MAGERKFVSENIKRLLMKEYIMKKVQGAGFGGLEINRTPMGTRVSLIIERPGLVIGRKGASIKNLTDELASEFGLPNPQIEVQEERNSGLNAQIMAEKLASALERGWKFRRAGHSTVRRIMDSGAKGCQVTIAGKLTGQRHRTAKFKQGHIKFCGEPSLIFMDRGYACAKLKPGVLGVTVWIMKADARLPDEITIGKEQPPAPAPVPKAVEPVDESGAEKKPVESQEAGSAEAKIENPDVAIETKEEPVAPETNADSGDDAKGGSS
ncbi:MAG: 30S ribosomal protein S3 [Candidatus Thermoplasmatota archaeon]|nr:30S ribosomal protein S3 [Candidatus Thermoplasmatota archaeon]